MEINKITTNRINFDTIDVDDIGDESISSRVRGILSGADFDDSGIRILPGDKVFGISLSTLRTIVYRQAGILGIRIRTTEVDGAIIVFKRSKNPDNYGK